MLKQEITYIDFDGNSQTETLYFNLRKSKVLDHIELVDDLQRLQSTIEGPERSLTTEEIKEILRLVKEFIQLSYGVRSEDGRLFRQTDELWTNFVDSAVYDEFLFSLFEKPEKAYAFLIGIIPQDVRAEAEKKLREGKQSEDGGTDNTPAIDAAKETQNVTFPQTSSVVIGEQTVPEHDQKDDLPAWMRENRNPTPEELRSMSQAELVLAYQRKSQQS